MAKILNGKIVRDKIAEKLKAEISRRNLSRARSRDSKIKLVIIQVGDLVESNAYIKQKVLFGEKIGAIVDHQKFPENISQENLIRELSTVNREPSVHGIIIQQPVPDHLDKDKIIEAIDPKKDVDGQTSVNIKLLFEGSARNTPGVESRSYQENTPGVNSGFVPATTKGILTLLDYYKIPVESKHVVVVGRSSLVGKPTALAFLNRDATVTICHSKTQNLPKITKSADILVAAAGKPKLITKKYVSKGQVVIDVGINIINHNHLRGERSYTSKVSVTSKPETEPQARKLIGDVDFDEVSRIVGAITPVPGGCGPMTVASLFQNLLEAYKRRQ